MNKPKTSAIAITDRSESYMTLGTQRVENDRFWRWGDDNLFPEALAQMARRSTTHRRIINDKADYISGKGFTCNEVQQPRLATFIREVNGQNESLRQVLNKLALDKALFGNAFLELVTDTGHTFLSLYHQDASRCRVARDSEHVLLHHNWAAFRPSEARSLPLYPHFEEQPDGSLRSIIHYKDYEPTYTHYGVPPYIAGFGTGTQKVEEMTKKMFPKARVLRMDMDTTSKKGGHEEILSAFGEGRADILIGTQMIVKGHDFPKVTLVGVLAADLSLYTSDFRCGERTFQLLTQAAGRAGRGELSGDVVIQTYNPEHYSIACAASQDYEAFYRQEMVYRNLLHYPPGFQLLAVMASCRSQETLGQAMADLSRWAAQARRQDLGGGEVEMIGPAQATVYKVNDIYRKILYLKQENYDILIQLKSFMEQQRQNAWWHQQVMIQYDFA